MIVVDGIVVRHPGDDATVVHHIPVPVDVDAQQLRYVIRDASAAAPPTDVNPTSRTHRCGPNARTDQQQRHSQHKTCLLRQHDTTPLKREMFRLQPCSASCMRPVRDASREELPNPRPLLHMHPSPPALSATVENTANAMPNSLCLRQICRVGRLGMRAISARTRITPHREKSDRSA